MSWKYNVFTDELDFYTKELSDLDITGFTQGSVLFIGASAVTEDNSNFFWDDSANQLKVSALDLNGGNITNVNKLAFTFDPTTFEDITVAAQGIFWQFQKAANNTFGLEGAANQDMYLYVAADGEAGSFLPAIWMSAFAGGTASIQVDGAALDLIANGDTTDFIRLQTVSNVPEITTVGACDLKITPTADLVLNPTGDISCSDNNITNVGDIALDSISSDVGAGGTIVVNEAGIDVDFRVESVNNSDAFKIDAGDGKIIMNKSYDTSTGSGLRLDRQSRVASGNLFGLQFVVNPNPTAVQGPSSTTTRGIDATINVGGGQTQSGNIIAGSFVVINNTGAITDISKGIATFVTSELGTITDSYGYFCGKNPTAGGTLTNTYGIYLEEQTDGATINNEIFLAGAGEIFFRDQAIHVGSLTDGHLDLTADITIDMNGVTLATDKIAFTQVDLNEYIDSLADGYLDLGATTAIRNKAVTIFEDAAYFTQTDGNEKIDSAADGYMDYSATTGHRLNNDVYLIAGKKLIFDGA